MTPLEATNFQSETGLFKNCLFRGASNGVISLERFISSMNLAINALTG